MTSYRDAVSYSSASMTSAQFPAPINDIILLGGDNRNMTINFNGQIDDVRIYTNAITEEQLKRIYNTQVQKLSNTQRSLTSQEKNLDYGIYSYQACVQDIRGTTVCTDARSYERAGLWIEKRSDKTSYYALDYITYTIDVGAYADANFTGIEIDEKLLTGLEYVSHTTQNLGTPTLSTGYNTTGDLLFNWSDISLSGGDQGTIILTAQIVNQFPPIEQPPVPYAESGFLTEEFWNNSPTDQEIVDALFSTDSAYTQHRNNYSDSTCSVGSSNVVHLYDGGSIPSPFTTNTIYVLHSGSYVTSDYTRMAECTAIIGEGDVNISTSTALTSNYAGTIRANCSSQVIVDNIKIDGQKGHATKNAIGIMMFNNCANSLYNYTINNTETYNNSSMGIYIRSREQDATTVAKTLGY